MEVVIIALLAPVDDATHGADAGSRFGRPLAAWPRRPWDPASSQLRITVAI